MNVKNLRKEIDLRFASGNSVPVERATVSASEWEAIAQSHDDLVAALNSLRVVAVDADLRATVHRTALKVIADTARAALEKAGAA